MLGVPSKSTRDRPSVEGATVLEMLWIGAHTSSLRERLQAIGRPSPKKLRSEGMFDVDLAKDQEAQESRHFEEAPLLPMTPQISNFEFEDATHGTVRACLNTGCNSQLRHLYQGLGHSSTNANHRGELVPFRSIYPLGVFGAIYCTRSSFFFTSCFYCY